MKEFTIGKNDAGQRLDRFVAKNLPLLPPALLQKYIRLKRIKVNGKGSKRDVRLETGDILQLYINDEFFDKPNEENLFLTVFKPQLNIVYEDENLLLVDKRPGMSVHADETEKVNTLINHIQAYLYQKREWNPKWENAFAPALCNRIDRNTGGIVIAAKNAETLRIINEKKTLFRRGKAEYRVYLTKAVRFIFEKGYLQIRKPVYFSPFLNLEDDGEECREWEKLDNLPEEWEEAYDVNTETEILAYKK